MSKWTGPISHGTFRSHVILGVMLEDLSIVQAREKRKRKEQVKEISSFNRTADGQIVTLDHLLCYDFSLFLTPTRYWTNYHTPNDHRRLLSMTNRTLKTSSPKILRRYPYRSPRLCLSIQHVILYPHRLRSRLHLLTCRSPYHGL